jgi:8-oxo-dGTP diphosphatase
MITVTCAIIEKDGKVLCAKRSEIMQLPGKWEFPGGKTEQGELPEDCIKREIREELGIEIEIIEKLPAKKHNYSPGFHFELVPFRCRQVEGILEPGEHEEVRWLAKEELRKLNWAAADIPVLEDYLAR